MRGCFARHATSRNRDIVGTLLVVTVLLQPPPSTTSKRATAGPRLFDTLGDPDYVEQPPNEGRGFELVRVGELLAWIEDDVQYFVTIIDGEAGAKGSVECSDELAVAC